MKSNKFPILTAVFRRFNIRATALAFDLLAGKIGLTNADFAGQATTPNFNRTTQFTK